MANYLLLFRGGSMPEAPADQKAVMDAWTAWFGGLGSALVDGGNPTSQGKTVNADGSISGSGQAAASGYSIVKADSLDAALDIAKGCPVLAGGASIDVCETLNVM